MRKKGFASSRIIDNKEILLKQKDQPMEHLEIATALDLERRSKKKKKSQKMRHGQY
jgi:hypothetical protein